ncbi:MAG: glycosyltransferase, partial [Chloroflexi bacterium]|nr:glycosyltransferase [Chloroflexota bacterium]
MKITLVGPVYPYRGGIAHHTDLLTRALRERHDVQVVSFRRQYPRWLYPGRSDREPSDEEQAVEAEFWLDPLQPWTWWQTSRRIEQFNPELVVIQWWTTFWAPAFATMAYLLRRAGLSPAFIVHNVLPHEPRPGDGLLARLALRQATKFIVHAAREGKRLRALFPHAKLEVCPLPCFGQFADQRTSRAKARQRIWLPQDGPVVLLFGLIRPYKGLRYLIEAVSLLHREACSIRLVVAGEFWDDIAHYRQQ